MSVQKREPPAVYQLKITLLGTRPPIWRRIQVASDVTLERLHDILQIVMGWTDSHLHEFVSDGREFGTPNPEIPELENERRVRLNQVLKAPNDKMTYEYDFGDSWEHQVLLEKVLPPEPGVRYPVVVTGKRAGPPEDVGGVFGYADFIDAIRDPNSPEREEFLEWAGEDFDPEAFDVEEVNRDLEYVRR